MNTPKRVEKKDFLPVALEYFESGLKPIPIDARKIPSIPKKAHPSRKWGVFQDSMTEEDVHNLFSQPCEGIAIITGGDLEVLDLDLKYDQTGRLDTDLLNACYNHGIDLMTECVVVETPSGGFHFLYRCKRIEGNQKLAMRPATEEELKSYNDEVDQHNDQLKKDQDQGDRKQEKPRVNVTDPNRKPMVIIETRGTGGYVGTFPGPGYSLDIGDLKKIPYLSEEKRDLLMTVCRSFNQVIKHSQKSQIDRKVATTMARTAQPSRSGDFEGKPSWEDYHEKSDPVQLLLDRGWTISHEGPERIFLRRPGKSRGYSADYKKDTKILAVWTTSTFLEDKHYSPFGLYTELFHNGDPSAAAKQLYADGYGDRQTRSDDTSPQAQPSPSSAGKTEKKGRELSELVLAVEARKFNVNDPIKNIRACLSIRGQDLKIRKVASFGHLVLIQGKTGYGKSFLTSNIVTSGLGNGKEVLSFRMNFMGRKVHWYDTEQPDTFFQLNQKRMFLQAGLTMNRVDYNAFPLEDLSKKERFQLIEHHIYNTEGLGAVVIDGIADLCQNVNDLGMSEFVVDHLRKWKAERNILIFCVIHENPQMNKAKGHLGSILYEKCDALFRVTKLGENDYQVNIPKSRFGPLPAFNFFRDSEGIGRTDLDDPEDLVPDPDVPEGFIPLSEAEKIKVEVNITKPAKTNDDEDIPF